MGFGTAENGRITAIPYLLSVIGMVWWSRRSDDKNERMAHVIIPALLSASGFLLAAFTLSRPVIAVTGLTLASIGVFSSFPVFWTLPTAFLTGTTAAAAVAFINSIGNISGIVEPSLIGWTRDISGGFALMLVLLAAILSIAAILPLLFERMSRHVGL